jgi:hypothetical protein
MILRVKQKGQKLMKSKAEHEFKVGDHVEWNSEAGRVRGTIQKKVTSTMKFKTYEVQDLHGPRLEGGATIFNQERQDGPHGNAQRLGSEEAQKNRKVIL